MDKNKLENIYNLMCEKTAINAKKIGNDLREFPAKEDGEYFAPPRDSLIKTEHIFCWTQSFFTGMALLCAQHTGDIRLIEWCNSFYDDYYKKVFDNPKDTMHDLGFLYTLYSTFNWKLTKSPDMRALSLRAAEVLAHRLMPMCKCIKAWGTMDKTVPSYVGAQLAKDNFFANSNGLAIIDCMMNLPLLFWAGQESGDVFFTSVATAHANTTLKYFVREDGSVRHAYRFNEETGEPQEEFNDCGYSVGSHWARGTAWAVYGFAVAWRYTKNISYRDAALKIADAYLKACGESVIPVWDFRLPEAQPARYGGKEQAWTKWDITKPENCKYNIDSSAAAIIACGFLDILEQEEHPHLRTYAEKTLTELTQNYLNLDTEIPGLLRCVNGLDTYGCFGDYFAMELVARCLGKRLNIW